MRNSLQVTQYTAGLVPYLSFALLRVQRLLIPIYGHVYVSDAYDNTMDAPIERSDLTPELTPERNPLERARSLYSDNEIVRESYTIHHRTASTVMLILIWGRTRIKQKATPADRAGCEWIERTSRPRPPTAE
ncbi:hypothetical protein EVAR_81480_1 [Eumeta japonica]|uniref:Uncharacterized protein n=1 Tax=Eumeta variegata TaxID=151549 RepID=A0A4C1W2E0_EUMVA|nr:hypothetical protein EVAR_81480_1 [Eumeta japonica]